VQGLHAGVETRNCVLVSDPDHLIGTLGVHDLIVIQNGNATLITTRKGESDVKKLVDKIRADGLGSFL
jgi:mannose-1-phosphate guanylyltransferase